MVLCYSATRPPCSLFLHLHVVFSRPLPQPGYKRSPCATTTSKIKPAGKPHINSCILLVYLHRRRSKFWWISSKQTPQWTNGRSVHRGQPWVLVSKTMPLGKRPGNAAQRFNFFFFFLAPQNAQPDLSLGARLHPQLSRIVTVNRTNSRTVTREPRASI